MDEYDSDPVHTHILLIENTRFSGEGFSNRLETLLGQPTFGAFSFLFESTYTFFFLFRQVPEPFGCFICDGIFITLFLIL